MPTKPKKHYAGATAKRASCGFVLKPNTPRVTNEGEFWQADQDGTLCHRCYRSATNEASPY